MHSMLPILLCLLLLVPNSVTSRGKTLPLQNNATNSSNYSQWLTRIKNQRSMGCRRRPWICNRNPDFPGIRRLCCRDRCVEVTSDVNNCGFCRIRCPFTWQCCRGICTNTNKNPFHCGKCGHRCRYPSLCRYGICGYAQPLSTFTFPYSPRPLS